MNSSDDEIERRADERVDAAAVADLADFPMRAAAGSFGSDDEQSDGGGSVGGDIDRIRSRVAAQRRGDGDDNDDPAAAAAAADIRQRFSTFKPESKHDVVSPPVKRVDSFNWDGVQIGGAGSSPGNVVGIGGSAVGVTGAAGTSSPRLANGLPSGIPKPASLSNKGKSQSARGPNPSSSPFLSKSPAGNSGPAGGDASDRLEAMPQPMASLGLGTGPPGGDAMQAKLMELARRNKQLTLALHREKEKAIRSAAEANSLQAASAAAGADGTRKGAASSKPAVRKGNATSRSATGGDQHAGDDGYAMSTDVRRQHQQQHPSSSSSSPSSEPMTALQQSEALVRQLNGALQKAQRTSERAMIELRVTHRILQVGVYRV